jgi:hypothetical protein
MEKVVYLIMSRQNDSFKIIYADNCEHTSDEKFFMNHPSFKCWNDLALEKSLHLAILPMFESENEERKRISDLIIARYYPACNEEIKEVKPDYKIRQKSDTPKISCPCCGSEMKVDQVIEKTTIIRCTECGISDTRLNS